MAAEVTLTPTAKHGGMFSHKVQGHTMTMTNYESYMRPIRFWRNIEALSWALSVLWSPALAIASYFLFREWMENLNNVMSVILFAGPVIIFMLITRAAERRKNKEAKKHPLYYLFQLSTINQSGR